MLNGVQIVLQLTLTYEHIAAVQHFINSSIVLSEVYKGSKSF